MEILWTTRTKERIAKKFVPNKCNNWMKINDSTEYDSVVLCDRPKDPSMTSHLKGSERQR